MPTHPVFSETHTPCGEIVFEVELSDWRAANWVHPVTGEPADLSDARSNIVREEDPANRYGVTYWVLQLSDGTPIRVLND
jgi:hypothetical protein